VNVLGATEVSYRDLDFSTRSMTASSPGTSEPISATDGGPYRAAQVGARRRGRRGCRRGRRRRGQRRGSGHPPRGLVPLDPDPEILCALGGLVGDDVPALHAERLAGRGSVLDMVPRDEPPPFVQGAVLSPGHRCPPVR